MGANKKLYGWYAADKKWLPIKVSMGGSIIISEIPDHAAKHQVGGDDELIVTGLAGLLANCQTPCSHHESHEKDGADEIVVTGLVGLPDAIPQYLIAKWDYSNGAIPTGWSLYEAAKYSIDKCVDGTPSATCEWPKNEVTKAFDDNETTYWSTGTNCSCPGVYLRYDFGVGISHIIRRVRIKSYVDSEMKTFKIQGSNNETDWTDLKDCSGVDTTDWQNFDFTNTIAYRYIQKLISESYHASGYVATYEVEMKILSTALIIKD